MFEMKEEYKIGVPLVDEEEYMESINYKRIFTQKIDHANFIKKIYEMDLNKVDEDQDEAIRKPSTNLLVEGFL